MARSTRTQLVAGESLEPADDGADDVTAPAEQDPASAAPATPPAPATPTQDDEPDPPPPPRAPRARLIETEPYGELRGPNGLEGYEQRGGIYGLDKQLRRRA